MIIPIWEILIFVHYTYNNLLSTEYNITLIRWPDQFILTSETTIRPTASKYRSLKLKISYFTEIMCLGLNHPDEVYFNLYSCRIYLFVVYECYFRLLSKNVSMPFILINWMFSLVSVYLCTCLSTTLIIVKAFCN